MDRLDFGEAAEAVEGLTRPALGTEDEGMGGRKVDHPPHQLGTGQDKANELIDPYGEWTNKKNVADHNIFHHLSTSPVGRCSSCHTRMLETKTEMLLTGGQLSVFTPFLVSKMVILFNRRTGALLKCRSLVKNSGRTIYIINTKAFPLL